MYDVSVNVRRKESGDALGVDSAEDDEEPEEDLSEGGRGAGLGAERTASQSKSFSSGVLAMRISDGETASLIQSQN